MTKTTSRVSQVELARGLGITDRRIRQLVDERILPPAADGGFALDLCEHRYKLYTSGREDDWNQAFRQAEMLAEVAADLVEKAYADGAVAADVTAASIAVQAST